MGYFLISRTSMVIAKPLPKFFYKGPQAVPIPEPEVIDLRRAWIAGFLSEIENIDSDLDMLEAVNWARDHHWIPKTAAELSHEIADGINGSVGKTYALSFSKKAV
jgi:hypothetical protein